jgi:hypothetical protein
VGKVKKDRGGKVDMEERGRKYWVVEMKKRKS